MPRVFSRMTGGSYQVTSLVESFEGLARKMGVKAGLEEAIAGNAFSFSFRGKGIVAMSNDMVQSLSSEEAEAVLAHELSHIKNRDSSLKSLARMARLAFPFDPVIHLVEAAVHRERELLADRASVTYTGKPLALASALLKACQAPPSSMIGAGAGLCTGGNGKGLFNRYPELERRIDILVDLAKRMRVGKPLEASHPKLVR